MLLANHAYALKLDDTENADAYAQMDAWALARRLDLAFCGLARLPARIVDARTAHLRRLDLERNQLEEIEAVVGLTALYELRAGHNRIARIPAALPGALTQLRTLSLPDNRIREVPPDISSLAKLTCVGPRCCSLSRARGGAPRRSRSLLSCVETKSPFARSASSTCTGTSSTRYRRPSSGPT